jgi:hypothetical protein
VSIKYSFLGICDWIRRNPVLKCGWNFTFLQSGQSYPTSGGEAKRREEAEGDEERLIKHKAGTHGKQQSPRD